ncbi:hypothetical protein RN001_010888 [Aquatica leii]|uniref:Peptidase S1 domain-containing protein n=1 Tax=Aquatica leii TaxID=1421715 RepID=A0AAN7P792_9COLE|nr:hypothetical protein RN001_010888 [Aquatica leii]
MFKSLGVLVILGLIAEAILQETDLDRHTTVETPTEFVDVSEAPFQVSVKIFGRHVCSGSILNEQMVLTAFHCTMWGVISDIQVRAGTLNPYIGGQEVNVKGICTYASKDELEPYKDIQILILEKELTFETNVQPIQLSFNDISDGTTALITGWNVAEGENFTSSKQPQIVSLTKMSNELCPGYANDNALVCFSSSSEKLSNVKTGSPLIVNGKQVGIDAYSYKNQCDNNRGFYIMLKAHRAFITKCIAHNLSKKPHF